MPKLSVVIPNYNHARFLQRRLDTVINQTFQDFELILLDDSSTDDSRRILSQYVRSSRVRIEFNAVNSGSTFKQWNKGVRLAQGKYIWIAESDDYADERFLEHLVPLLDENPTVAFAYCRAWCITGEVADGFVDKFYADLGPSHWTADFCVDGHDECRNYLVQCNTITNTSGVVFRRSTFEQLGGADESLRLCGDWKLWAAMALTGKIAYIAQPLNYLRFHGATVRSRSTDDALDTAECLHVIRWILERVTPEPRILAKLRKQQAASWVRAILTPRVSLKRKRAILREVRAIDPHPLRSALRPALSTVQLKFMRHWRELRSKPSPAS